MTRYLFASLLATLPAAPLPAADRDFVPNVARGRAQAGLTPPKPSKPDYARPKAEAPRSDEPVVHLLAVADSNDPAIGAKVADDARNVAAAFEESFRAAGKDDRLRVRVVLGRETTGANILAAVRDLAVRPQDAVVVLYSGHGSIDGRDRRGLDLAGGDRLPVADLLAAMEAHGPRLAVLLTDVCSSFVPARPGDERAGKPGGAEELPRGRVIPWATVEHLFLSHRGVVDITAAAPGQPAAVDARGPGSHFTNAMIEVLTTPHPSLVSALDRNGDRAIQWAELLPQVRTVAAARHRTAGGVGSGGPQQATALALGTWAPAGRVAAAE